VPGDHRHLGRDRAVWSGRRCTTSTEGSYSTRTPSDWAARKSETLFINRRNLVPARPPIRGSRHGQACTRQDPHATGPGGCPPVAGYFRRIADTTDPRWSGRVGKVPTEGCGVPLGARARRRQSPVAWIGPIGGLDRRKRSTSRAAGSLRRRRRGSAAQQGLRAALQPVLTPTAKAGCRDGDQPEPRGDREAMKTRRDRAFHALSTTT